MKTRKYFLSVNPEKRDVTGLWRVHEEKDGVLECSLLNGAWDASFRDGRMIDAHPYVPKEAYGNYLFLRWLHPHETFATIDYNAVIGQAQMMLDRPLLWAIRSRLYDLQHWLRWVSGFRLKLVHRDDPSPDDLLPF